MSQISLAQSATSHVRSLEELPASELQRVRDYQSRTVELIQADTNIPSSEKQAVIDRMARCINQLALERYFQREDAPLPSIQYNNIVNPPARQYTPLEMFGGGLCGGLGAYVVFANPLLGVAAATAYVAYKNDWFCFSTEEQPANIQSTHRD